MEDGTYTISYIPEGKNTWKVGLIAYKFPELP